ncbi:hypothetical protein JHK85_038898 [Glycine max]|nr:hypothetical protein JHK85_038898 [Glycine max]
MGEWSKLNWHNSISDDCCRYHQVKLPLSYIDNHTVDSQLAQCILLGTKHLEEIYLGRPSCYCFVNCLCWPIWTVATSSILMGGCRKAKLGIKGKV